MWRRWWPLLLFFPAILCAKGLIWKAESEEEALFLRRIAAFWEEGEYQIAKMQMEEFLTDFPKSTSAESLHAALGDLCLRENDHQGALKHYVSIASLELIKETFLNRMQCLYHLQWHATLADECERFLRQEGLAANQKLQATYFLAIALYQQCLNASQEPETLAKLAERARPYFASLFESELSVEVAQGFAHLCCILKDYPKAANIYLELAKKDPSQEEEMLFQAALIQSEYDSLLAEESFAELAKRGSRRAQEAAYNCFVLTFERGQFETIAAQRQSILQVIPPERASMAHLFLGRSFLSLGKYAEAVAELQLYITQAPPSETLDAALLSLLEAASQSENLEALDLCLAKLPPSGSVESAQQAPHLLNGQFARAKLLRKRHQVDAARVQLEELLAKGLSFPHRAAAFLELIQLEYEGKSWASCQRRARELLAEFPKQEETLYALRYLASAAAERSRERPEEVGLKETFAADVEELLKWRKHLPPAEALEWQFVLSRVRFELGAYEEASRLALPLLQEGGALAGNGNLLLAFCYRDGKGDLATFCSFAEKAIQHEQTLMEMGALHALLFNAYLERTGKEPALLERAASHLYAAFQARAQVQRENLLWLAEHYLSRCEEKAPLGLGLTPSPEGQQMALRASLLFKAILRGVDVSSQETLFCRWAKAYTLSGQKEEGIAILESLVAAYTAAPARSWARQKEAELLLAEAYSTSGREEKALVLFDTIVKTSINVRSLIPASASLQGARLRRKKLAQEVNPHLREYNTLLIQLKDLIVQRTLSNEPLHLEAAIEYVEVRCQLDPSPVKHLALWKKVKSDFEKREDLLSRDYHEARAKLPEKNRLYESYQRFFEAQICLVQAKPSSGHGGDGERMRKELQAKAKGLFLQIIDENAHPAVVQRAKERLEQE